MESDEIVAFGSIKDRSLESAGREYPISERNLGKYELNYKSLRTVMDVHGDLELGRIGEYLPEQRSHLALGATRFRLADLTIMYHRHPSHCRTAGPAMAHSSRTGTQLVRTSQPLRTRLSSFVV